MKYLNTAEGATYIGLAYSPGACEFIEAHPELVDYVEIPFEQLRHAPTVGSIQEKIPVILHCASMSVAGFVPPEAATLDAIASEAKRTRTPWIGEHLAFVTADALDAADASTRPATCVAGFLASIPAFARRWPSAPERASLLSLATEHWVFGKWLLAGQQICFGIRGCVPRRHRHCWVRSP